MHRTRRSLCAALIVSAFASGVAGCEGQMVGDDGTGNDRIASLHTDLGPGSSGPDVEAVQGYLVRFGYFPNAPLAQAFPRWRPIVSEAPRPGSYDRPTEAAVRAYQHNGGLSETGVVDAATRLLMNTPRCGEPDGIPRLDPSNKFALTGTQWFKHSLTWAVLNADDVTLDQVRSAAHSAFSAWAGETDLKFTEAATGTADINILFTGLGGGVLALGETPNPSQTPIHIQIAAKPKWSVTNPPPAGAFDLQTVLAHEIGHTLGLSHSSVINAGTPIMATPQAPGEVRRRLQPDDRIAISLLYDKLSPVSGSCAQDIAVSSSGPWIVGCDGRVRQWGGTSFSRLDITGRQAARISVDPNNVPWIVDFDGNTFFRNSSSATSGSWTQVAGCAADIGIGANGTVWKADCIDFSVQRWNGSGWERDPSAQQATRISVDAFGAPWIVDRNGQLKFKVLNSLQAPWFDTVPGDIRDVAVAGSPTPYAWVTGNDGNCHWIWNEQVQQGSGNPSDTNTASAAEKNQWVVASICLDAREIAVGGAGNRPWITTGDGTVWRPAK